MRIYKRTIDLIPTQKSVATFQTRENKKYPNNHNSDIEKNNTLYIHSQILHVSTFLQVGKRSNIMQSSMKIMYIFLPWCLQNFRVVTTDEFFICYKFILWFFTRFKYLQIVKEIILQFFVLFIALTRKDRIWPSKGKYLL